MYDLHTAMQIALSPAATLSVIAALAIIIVAQAIFGARRLKDRLRARTISLAKLTGAVLAAKAVVHKRDSERQVAQAIEATYDALKDVGFDKLASGEVTFEGVMFGDSLPKDEPFKRRQFRDMDPLASFSMDELREAFGDKPHYTEAKPGAEPHSFEEPLHGGGGLAGDAARSAARRAAARSAAHRADEGAGLGGRGPRPFHTATHDFSGR